MTPTIETALLIAGIGMTGIFVFMAIFYLLIIGLDKLFPFIAPSSGDGEKKEE